MLWIETWIAFTVCVCLCVFVCVWKRDGQGDWECCVSKRLPSPLYESLWHSACTFPSDLHFILSFYFYSLFFRVYFFTVSTFSTVLKVPSSPSTNIESAESHSWHSASTKTWTDGFNLFRSHNIVTVLSFISVEKRYEVCSGTSKLFIHVLYMIKACYG